MRISDGITDDEFARQREFMVSAQIEARGIKDRRVLKAMREVPRHLFIPEKLKSSSYDDTPLPIGYGQTISQPYIVALMTELLEPKGADEILEIGTGSGYQSAVLSRIVKKVYTIERVAQLAERARNVWKKLGYDNIISYVGNGWNGLEEHSPYDGIIVTAAAEEIPENLLNQLKIGAKLVIPLGTFYQKLWVIERTETGFDKRSSIAVRFVPLINDGDVV